MGPCWGVCVTCDSGRTGRTGRRSEADDQMAEFKHLLPAASSSWALAEIWGMQQKM